MATDQLERECWAEGRTLLSCDESGFGCIAGRMYCAGVVFPIDYDFGRLPGLNDSKELSDEKRFELEPLIKQDALWWFCEAATAAEIDAGEGTPHNVYWLRFELAERAINNHLFENPRPIVLMDGNKALRLPGWDSRCLVKADLYCKTTSAASVLAKCAKNREMDVLHKQYPEYGWNSNKGYWKKEHVVAIEKFGFTEYHRRSYCKRIKVD